MTNYSESKLLKDARLHLGQQEDLVVWRNETATLTRVSMLEIRMVISLVKSGQKNLALDEMNSWLSRGMVACGLCRGSSDLVGIYSPSGRMFALELKTEKGTVEEEQHLFLKLVRRMGGFAAVARNMEQVKDALARLREGKNA